MNIVINNIIDDDNELFNRVRAIGPGDGINRMMYVVEDASSIAAYGVREKVQEFPSVTTYSELQTQADALLATIKDPVKEIEFTYYFDSSLYDEEVMFNGEIVTYGGSPVTQLMPGSMLDMVRGDEVRVVSQSLGLSFTGVIDELDWSLGKVNVRLGQPYYNLIDVINGPDQDRKRVDEALKLPAPIGVSAVTGAPGVNITINPYTNSRIVGTEIYADTSSGFTPDRSTLLLRSQDTKFEFPDLLGGVTYYFQLRSYDNQGNVSDFAIATADGGFIPTTKFKVGNVVIDDTGSSGGQANAVRVYDGTGFDAADEVVRLGYINGLDGVPGSIDYGLWGTLGTGVYINGVPKVLDYYEATVGGTDTVTGVAGDGFTATFTKSLTFQGSTSLVVPSGKRWSFTPTAHRVYYDLFKYAPLVRNGELYRIRATDSSGNYHYNDFIGGETYTSLTLQGNFNYTLFASLTSYDLDFTASVNVVVFEVDEPTSTVTVTGGTATTDGDYTIRTFNSSGTLTVGGTRGYIDCDILIVGGGGGGGYGDDGGISDNGGGGGGSGGLVNLGGIAVNNGTYTITIGSGGAGATSASPGNGGNGNSTTTDIPGIPDVLGGEGGMFSNTSSSATIGTYAGGAGAGGRGQLSGDPGIFGGPGSGGNGTFSQGSPGGNSDDGVLTKGGGGGGSAGGLAGGDASTGRAGSGGGGRNSDITGTLTTYVGGGGGGSYVSGDYGFGGGEGGNGGDPGRDAQNGTANRGGGGGGGAGNTSTLSRREGGNGGSGVFIIRYRTP